MVRKTKKDFFNNLDINSADNNQFWKTVKPCLTDKTLKDERITLTENEKVESEERELVKIFHEYFSYTVSYLNIQRPPNITLHHDPVQYAMKNFVPSDKAFPFSFGKVTLNQIINEIKN